MLPQKSSTSLFVPAWDRNNQPSKIVTLGHCYPRGKIAAAKTLVRETDHQAGQVDGPSDSRLVRDHLAWTRLLNALNLERQWPLKRLYEMLDPMLKSGVAVAVVPPHKAYQAFWPMKTLAQRLAGNARVDATSCLVRHTTIRRIVFGGPSTRALHRQTIQVKDAELIRGQRVLLLDDIAKSGASLMACRGMLLEAGAEVVQAMALGRVIVGE